MMLAEEQNLLELKYPVTVVGDIHGQFYDLLKLLEMAGDIASSKYLFLGDYVDRGSFSVEVLLLLYTLKLNFPAEHLYDPRQPRVSPDDDLLQLPCGVHRQVRPGVLRGGLRHLRRAADGLRDQQEVPGGARGHFSRTGDPERHR